MSDFDLVLERLLTEPSFAAALADDPNVALAGYRLDEDEVALLRSQVVGDTAADVAKVETRTNKSSTFGLLAPFAALGGVVDSLSHHLADAGWGTGGGEPAAHTALGAAPHSGLGAAPGHQAMGDAPHQALGQPPRGHAEPEQFAAPKGYHPRIDADGDGTWDKATYTGDRDGGVEIRVDLNHDGKADFIGHDVDRDGKVDYADYDKDHDGVFEKRMYDDDNDGWLDRTVRKYPKN
jgi:hypothetical protein